MRRPGKYVYKPKPEDTETVVRIVNHAKARGVTVEEMVMILIVRGLDVVPIEEEGKV